MSVDPREPDPAPEPGLERLLDLAAAPRARADFRARLRAEFTGSPGEQAEPRGASGVGGPAAAESRFSRPAPDAERTDVLSPPPRRLPWLQLASLAAIAAAAVLLYRWPSPSGWRVSDASDFAVARVDGRSFTPRDAARLAAALAPGSVVEVEGGALELVLDRRLALSLASGCGVVIIGVPQQGALGDLVVDQVHGSLAVVTGPDFEGSSLRILTPGAVVRALGTEFSLDVLPGLGTCVCCGEGRLGVVSRRLGEAEGPAPEPQWIVAAGSASLVAPAGTEAESGPAHADHLAPLASLRRVWD